MKHLSGGFVARLSSPSAKRGALLLGTALVSSLIALAPMTATTAQAQAQPCVQPAPPNPIDDTQANPIVCVNADTRNGDAVSYDAIYLRGDGIGSSVDLTNSGALTAYASVGNGINIYTPDDDSFVVVRNTGGIAAADGHGIYVQTYGDRSGVTIVNTGAIESGDETIQVDTNGDFSAISIYNNASVTSLTEEGIDGDTEGDDSAIRIENRGAVVADEDGIEAESRGDRSPITVLNYGSVVSEDEGIQTNTFYGDDSATYILNAGTISTTPDDAEGIEADSDGDRSAIAIVNRGAIETQGESAEGIDAYTDGDFSAIAISNDGAISTSGVYAQGIDAFTNGYSSGITIRNGGTISTSGGEARGIEATSYSDFSGVVIANAGAISTSGIDADGIEGGASGYYSGVTILNSGSISATGEDADGIEAFTLGFSSGVAVINEGEIASNYFGIDATTTGALSEISVANEGSIDARYVGIRALTLNIGGNISIVNRGDIETGSDVPGTALLLPGATDFGIAALTYGPNAIVIENSGSVAANGTYGVGIGAFALGTISIVNSGDVYGSGVGVGVISLTGTTVTNLSGGSISAESGPVIGMAGAAGQIFNAGLITGFVSLTSNGDYFENQSGGVFQAQGVSDFGGGDDLFRNKDGGVVDTADDADTDESVSFVNLERFENFGTISLVDGAPGDLFTIANVVGAANLDYEAGSNLNVDAFLGGPGSRSDIFRIDGNVAGVTDVNVFNTNSGPGVFNPDGIRVVEVTGAVDDDAFRLANGPIDTGFFNFDLFAEQDGTQTNFELRSFVGGGAFILPQLVTATQDIWHQTSDTWFNRSADLRTALRGGGDVPGVPGAMYLGNGSLKDDPASVGGLSPAVWAKASAGSLDRDDRASTSAFGRSYQFDLDRELFVADFQTGVDFGKRGVLNAGDALLVSVFGGGVFANLDYDRLDRRFDIDGGQVGVAATYLSGGLFVDALFNAQFLEVEADNFAFPQSFDAQTYGFRLDTGYRFQRSRFFLEPLLTLSVAESDLDGFSVGGNTVSFEEETSVRGRVGLRAGTTTTILGVHAEPYVIASYWSELGDGDTQRATLISSGTSFALTDSAEESWTEISFGSNYFLFGNNAVSAFTKTDIVFGHDIDGYQFTGGFRVQW